MTHPQQNYFYFKTIGTLLRTQWASHFKKIPVFFVGVLALLLLGSCSKTAATGEDKPEPQQTIVVPLGGNTWKAGGDETGGTIETNGIVNWTDKEVWFTTYARIATSGSFKVWLSAEAPEGQSRIQLSVLGKSKEITIDGSASKDYFVGKWQIEAVGTGYVAFKTKGISKTAEIFANISRLKLKGTAIGEQTRYVKNNEGNFFYWGRRGPSVHLTYKIPDNVHAEWFYNEVTIPEGNDVIGSYFMAIGFDGGYFGIQVNSETERRVLFSVWSPYETDNPEEVPKGQRIVLLRKGKGVHAGKFGDEGSGGQSYLKYDWEAGNTYKFLLHGQPNGDGTTTYTAYFYAPETGQWKLIASFKRPKTDTWLTGYYSFLENFIPSQGIYTRKVYFDNQWMRDNQGNWIELNKAKFTADNTARKGYRMDYAGGVKNGHFYLKNCGFFSDYTPIGTWFERTFTGHPPEIEWDKLP